MGLLRAETQFLRKLIAFVRCGLGRLGVEAEERGPFDLEQFRFQSAMSGCPCNAERGLGDVEGSLRISGPERLAEPGAGRRSKVRQMDLLRLFECGFEQPKGGLVFPAERMSVTQQRLMPGQSKRESDPGCVLDGRPAYRRRRSESPRNKCARA